MTKNIGVNEQALRTIFDECRQCGTCCKKYRKIVLQPDEGEFIEKMGGHVGVGEKQRQGVYDSPR